MMKLRIVGGRLEQQLWLLMGLTVAIKVLLVLVLVQMQVQVLQVVMPVVRLEKLGQLERLGLKELMELKLEQPRLMELMEQQ
jgi:hypothetical protein